VAETMLAARFIGQAHVRVEEIPVPKAGPGEILLKVDSCALCGSDRNGWSSGADVTPGHETSGTVVTIGEDVADPLPGATGVVFLVDACGACLSCRSRSPNRCLEKRAMYGFTAPGGLAEYVVVRASCFLPVAPEIPLDKATALLDLFGTTSHAFRLSHWPEMRSVLVIGCGPIGLGAIAIAKAEGASHVVGSDISGDRLELARTAGAVAVDASTPEAEIAIHDTAPDGFDVVIEAAGHPSAQRRALDLVAAGGVCAFIAHGPSPLEIRPSADLIANEITMIGAEYFRPDEFPENHERVRAGKWDPSPLITHTFTLEHADEACETFFGGTSGKVLVRP
jgi:threonine 3-dehydrogenase